MRPGRGRRPAPLPRRPRRAVPAAAGHVHRPQPRLPAGPARPRAGRAWPGAAASAGCPGTSSGTSPTTGCAGCSASRRSTRASRRSGRSPPTPSSPSSTSAPASGTRWAASPRSPARWPPPRPTPASRSGTARPSSELETSGRRVTAVRLAGGERLPADAVVVTTDQPHTLVPGPARPRAGRCTRRPASRCTSASAHELPGQAHHTISFGDSWRGVFDELTRDGRPMTDPSLLVSMPSRTDRSLAPDGGQVLSVVAPDPEPRPAQRRQPRPGLGGARPALPRRAARAPWRPAGWTGLTGAIEVEEMATPLDWAAQGMAAGTPFALAHTFGQTGPFRPSTLPRRGPENVVLAGSSVQPGRGRADGADQRAAGRRADHRDDGRWPTARRELARRVRALRRDRRPARQELPPRHPAADRRPAAGRARPLRRRPHRRRPGRPARRRPRRRPRRLVRARCSPSWTRAGPTTRSGWRWCTPSAATTSRSSTWSTSSPP